MYSVNTEAQARELLMFTCPRNYNNEFVAPELAAEQTLENLRAFSDRLHEAAKRLGLGTSEEDR